MGCSLNNWRTMKIQKTQKNKQYISRKKRYIISGCFKRVFLNNKVG